MKSIFVISYWFCNFQLANKVQFVLSRSIKSQWCGTFEWFGQLCWSADDIVLYLL